MLSTGETPLVSFTEDGGTRGRVIQLRGKPFGDVSEEKRKLVTEINTQVKAHYGHAGPKFVEFLLGNKEQWDTWRSGYIQAMHHYATQVEGDLAGRLAEYMAVIAATAILVHQCFDLPWAYKDQLDVLWADIVQEAQDATGEEAAIAAVVSWAYTIEENFYGRHKDGAVGGWAGRWDSKEDWAFLGVYERGLKKVLTDEGYNYAAILHGWKEAGFIDVEDRRQYSKRVSVQGRKKPMICIKREVIDRITGSE